MQPKVPITILNNPFLSGVTATDYPNPPFLLPPPQTPIRSFLSPQNTRNSHPWIFHHGLAQFETEIDLQLLKGMCFWMGRDLEIVEKENREMKRLLDEMKLGRNNRLEESKGGGRKLSESNGEVQRWRSYKSERQEDEKKVQPNKPLSVATTDVESELEKAIKAATSTS